jgi:hypothetical protein
MPLAGGGPEMISIVRMKAQEQRDTLWDYLSEHAGELQGRLENEGRLLFLSQRAKHEDVSLFVHVADPDVLAGLIARDLAKIEGVTGCWMINMLKPLFFPLPRDTSGLSRYAITVRTFPPRLEETYESLSRLDMPPGIRPAYLALTCHLYGDCLQFSVLAEDERALERYLDEDVRTIPGVLRLTVSLIERTQPLVSYDEWNEYAATHPSWDPAHMINQFGSA